MLCAASRERWPADTSEDERRPNGEGTMKTALFLTASGVALALAATGSARAQAAPEGVSVGEVVVHAQKRSENLQSVPVSVSAVTSQTLQTSRIENINDLN